MFMNTSIVDTIQFHFKTQTQLSFTSHSNGVIATPRSFHLLQPLRCTSTTNPQTHPSFTFSYLVDSCGLSPERALTVSKRLNFKDPQRPDSVLNLFKAHNFSQSQISRIVSKRPGLLRYDPDKTLLPKFNFFYSKGLSNPDLVKVLSYYPYLLTRSLDNALVPKFNLLKDLLQSDDAHTMKIIKLCPSILDCLLEVSVLPNIEILRESNVPEEHIPILFRIHPHAFCEDPKRFKEALEEVRGLGFSLSKKTSVYALNVLLSMRRSTRERKFGVLKSCGWSEEDVVGAFRKCPNLLLLSEDNIVETMDYFVCRMGWDPVLIAKYPSVLGLSMKKRIVPRCEVVLELKSRGLIGGDMIRLPNQVFMGNGDAFLKRFVIPYLHKAPHLMELYQKIISGEISSPEATSSDESEHNVVLEAINQTILNE